ncbi:hypothetical protein GCM10023319_77060 [Nocardia iowensis]
MAKVLTGPAWCVARKQRAYRDCRNGQSIEPVGSARGRFGLLFHQGNGVRSGSTHSLRAWELARVLA